MEGVSNIFGLKVNQKETLGEATLSCFEYKDVDNPLYNLRMIRDAGEMFMMTDGEYMRLSVDGELVMSDTNMEKISNYEFIKNANGRVFIAGLGIGLILHNLREKVTKGEITEIVIMEISQDVIDLVSPYYKDLPIKYVRANVLEYKPTKKDIFDTIYFDIWPSISTENLEEIRLLHNRWKFRRNKNNPNSWMNSWMKEHLQSIRRTEMREGAYGYGGY